MMGVHHGFSCRGCRYYTSYYAELSKHISKYLNNCAKEHEQNYQEYAARLGYRDARYIATSPEELPAIGAEHKSKAVLGKGAFGEVHLALHAKTATAVAIKILHVSGDSEMNEIKIMSKICHVSYLTLGSDFTVTAQVRLLSPLT